MVIPVADAVVIPEAEAKPTVVFAKSDTQSTVVFTEANVQSTMVFSKATKSTIQSEVWLFCRAAGEAPWLQLLRTVRNLMLGPMAAMLPENFVKVGGLRLDLLVIGGVLSWRSIE